MPVLHEWKAVRDVPFKEFVRQNAPGKVLIERRWGAAGDVLCTRMLYEDVKSQCGEDVELWVSTPAMYHDLLRDHPYIDKLIDSNFYEAGFYDDEEFICSYDVSQTCGMYEALTAPYVDKHRSDIWAENSMGVTLSNHFGHIRFSRYEIKNAIEILNDMPGGKKIGLGVFTSNEAKDWCRDQKKFSALCNGILRRGMVPVLIHDREPPVNHIPRGVQFPRDLSFRMWMALCSQMDAMITSCTGNFHLANLTYRPTVSVSGPEDPYVYGKHHMYQVRVSRRTNRDKVVRPAMSHDFWDRKTGDKRTWEYCPCWNYGGCYYKEDRKKMPPVCLEDITSEEVLEALDQALVAYSPRGASYYGKDYYTNRNGSYDTDSMDRIEEHRAFVSMFPKSLFGDILDLGCGRGLTLSALRDVGCEAVVGIDHSKWAVDNKYDEAVSLGDITDIDPQGFETVICRGSLECVHDLQILPLFDRIRHGGTKRLIISVLAAHEDKARRANGDTDPSRVTVREDTWWANRLNLAGFKVTLLGQDLDRIVLMGTPV